MYTYVLPEYTDLRIPQAKIEQMLECLIQQFETIGEDLPDTLLSISSPQEKVLLLIELAGFDASMEQNGDIVIDDCAAEQLDTGDDPVLCSLIGITPSGSYLTLYGDDNSQWQVRYDDTKKWNVRGSVVFPQAENSFPLVFQPGN